MTDQTPRPEAKRDQKVLGRPGDLKLQGSLTTLMSDHLLLLITDKTKGKRQDIRACLVLGAETLL